MSGKILMTGATGTIAGLLVPQLLDKGVELRALVRNPEKARELRARGLEVIEGDLEDTRAVRKAVDGVEKVMLITPPHRRATALASPIIEEAARRGRPHIVRLSVILAAADSPTDNTRQHYQTEEQIKSTGLRWTFIRPHFFMQNLFMSAQSIAEHGAMYWGMGHGRLSMIDVRDIADTACRVLMEEGHEGKIYTLTGPQSITFDEAASILSEELGRNVSYIPVSLETVEDSIRSMTGDAWFAEVMRDYSKAYGEGWGDFVTKDTEKLTGMPARSFRRFAHEVMAPALSHAHA